MGWLTITEYRAIFLGGGHAQFDCAKPLVEQRLLIRGELMRSRAFSHKTNLIHVRADAPCMIEINQPIVSTDIAAGGEDFFAVLAGSQLTVIEDRFCPTTNEITSQELS